MFFQLGFDNIQQIYSSSGIIEIKETESLDTNVSTDSNKSNKQKITNIPSNTSSQLELNKKIQEIITPQSIKNQFKQKELLNNSNIKEDGINHFVRDNSIKKEDGQFLNQQFFGGQQDGDEFNINNQNISKINLTQTLIQKGESINEEAKNYAIDLIKEGEGYKEQLYYCTSNLPTIGYGHQITTNDNGMNKIDINEAESLLVNDMKDALTKVDAVFGSTLDKMSPERIAVLIDMSYNIGSLKSWKRLIEACKNEDWKQAGEEIMNSKYSKQVGERAQRNAKMMELGIKQRKEK